MKSLCSQGNKLIAVFHTFGNEQCDFNVLRTMKTLVQKTVQTRMYSEKQTKSLSSTKLS